ncbi:MAG: LysR family transcriptional regulator [Rhizobiaceae bacterium]|nr:LysR family transcriptional regulator [Rhizobiaceae bacterium]
MNDPKFAEYLSVFVDVVRAKSFSGAARHRSTTPSSVVRQIDALEEDLKVRLLSRSTRALALTEAGQRLYDRACRILDDLTDMRAEVTAMDGAIAGMLRIACFPTFGKRYVIPALEALTAEHSGLSIELDLTERLADPVLERLDVVIRIGVLTDSSLIATKLAPQRRVLVASQAYLDRYGTPASREDLACHRLLDKLHGNDLLGWKDVLGVAVRDLTGAADAFRSDDFEALRGAALAAIGIALLPTWVVGPDVTSGSLVMLPIGPDEADDHGGIYLLRALSQPSAKVRAFQEVLRRGIGAPPIWEIKP